MDIQDTGRLVSQRHTKAESSALHNLEIYSKAAVKALGLIWGSPYQGTSKSMNQTLEQREENQSSLLYIDSFISNR